jgi:hypothetical protein
MTLTPGTYRSGVTGLGGGVPEEPFGHAPTGSVERGAEESGGGFGHACEAWPTHVGVPRFSGSDQSSILS